MTDLKLFNSLTRQLETFDPVHPGTEGDPNDPPEARVYSCGPTVYNYQHIGNMRAYVFADTLGRVLSYKGYKLTHVINITDVGHLTSDADEGEDKMEKMAAAQGKTAWDIAAFYQADFEADLARLNIRKPQHPKATEYVEQMKKWAESIADKHCYELESGLYFDISTVPEYGRLARAVTDDGEGRIEEVDGKRNKADFAIWRKTPEGETRQMEWPSPWGMGAPGWHLECSVMSKALLGMPFDIHTGGIDHREIHHPNEIAQNQAHEGCADTGARIWMHNNFLVERSGKMSKSSGEFLRLQLLIDKGFHPLAYRLMCLQAHYRSELEFSWEGLQSAFVRLKRLVRRIEALRNTAGLSNQPDMDPPINDPVIAKLLFSVEQQMSEDLNTSASLTFVEEIASLKQGTSGEKLAAISAADKMLGLGIDQLSRFDLRVRPVSRQVSNDEIHEMLIERANAKLCADFAKSDAIRDDLIAKGVEVMDGDPLGWDWKLDV
jgi:cysteinyl-tRNA synthetase